MSKSSQDQTLEEEQTGNTGGSFAPLGSAIESIQGSVGSVAQNLAQNLQSNMALINSIGSAIGNMIQSNVTIASHLQPVEDSVQLIISIVNKTSLPLLNVKGQVIFDPKEKVSIEHTDSYFLIIDERNEESVELMTPSLFENPIRLDSMSKYEQICMIKTQEPLYAVGKIRLTIPHPSRGSEIVVERSFGLYLVDQLIKSAVTSLEEHVTDVVINKEYPVEFIRELMQIHPIRGMEKGMGITLSGKKFEVWCKVVDFSGDNTTCQVEFLLINGDPSTLKQVISELDLISQTE